MIEQGSAARRSSSRVSNAAAAGDRPRVSTSAHKAALLYADGVRGGLFRDEDPELTAQLVVTLFDNVLYEAIAYERPAPLAPLVLHATRFVPHVEPLTVTLFEVAAAHNSPAPSTFEDALAGLELVVEIGEAEQSRDRPAAP